MAALRALSRVVVRAPRLSRHMASIGGAAPTAFPTIESTKKMPRLISDDDGADGGAENGAGFVAQNHVARVVETEDHAVDTGFSFACAGWDDVVFK